MATAIQRRRGTTAQHSSFTGLAGEITIDTSKNTVVVHDGSTAGGFALATEANLNNLGGADITDVVAGSGLTGGATSGSATISVNEGYFDQTAGGTGWAGNLEPAANNVHSLGSLTNVWKDVYVGPGSLYVNGQKVLEDNSGTIQFSADNNQNISILTTGSGDLEMTAGGSIQLKSDIALTTNKTISSTGGVKFASNINMNSNNINNVDDPVSDQDAATKGYVDAQVSSKDALGELSGDTDDVDEGTTNLYYTDARTRAAVSSGNGINYESATGTFTAVESELDIHSLSGYVANENVDHSGVSIQAGAGLTGGGDITVNRELAVGAGDGISVAADAVAVDSSVVRTSGDQTIAGEKTFSDDAVFSGNVTISGTSTTVNSTITSLADSVIELNRDASGAPSENAGFSVNRGSSADVTLQWDESADVWQFTNDGSSYQDMLTDATARALISGSTSGDGSLSYDSNTGVITYTGPGNSDYRAALTVTHASGDGSASYDQSTGIISIVGASAAETRAHFSGGTGISFASGEFAIGQSVGTSDSVTFADVTGDLTGDVTGTVSSIANHDTGDLSEGTNKYFTDARADARFDIKIQAADTDNLSEGSSNQYYTDARARAAISATGDISYNSTTGVFSFTNDAGDIEGVVAGTGLTGGGTSGSVTLNVAGLTLNELADGTVIDSGESFANNDTTLMTSAAIEDKILAYGYTTNVGDITGITAGNGLTGGGSSGTPTLNIGEGTGITVSADEIAVSASYVKGLLSGSNGVNYDGSTGAISADSAEIRAMFSASGDISYNSGTGVFSFTNDAGDIEGVTAGNGLTGGGSSGTVVLNVVGGTGISVAADEISVDASGVDIHSLSGYVANENIDHSSVSITAGSGLTGGGSIAASRTINIGAGSYINVAADSVSVDATSSNSASKVVARDGSGNFSAGTITATATTARYADLAEMYASDADMEPGTVVCFGGEAEVTACDKDSHHAVAGVVSTDPAYLMNNEAEGVAVALCGRVPTKVIGPVQKGDLMVSSGTAGHAKADNNAAPGRILGKAIGSSEGGEAVIEVLVNLM